jgi:hypothetical protein
MWKKFDNKEQAKKFLEETEAAQKFIAELTTGEILAIHFGS